LVCFEYTGGLNVGIPLETVVRRDWFISPHDTMIKGKDKDNDRFVTMLKGWIDQFALSLTNSDTKNYIQQLIIEPFMEYIFQRAFPYAIIAICIILSIFITVIVICILLLLHRNKCSVCDRLLS
jgi:hypothetical protein